MIEHERRKQMQHKMIEHLEAALAIADETESGQVGYAIEVALDTIRAENWPTGPSPITASVSPSGASA